MSEHNKNYQILSSNLHFQIKKVTHYSAIDIMEEPETVSEKQKSHFLKRKKSGSGILKRLSLTGNKKRFVIEGH